MQVCGLSQQYEQQRHCKKTNEKISEALREKLEAEGVEVVVEYEPHELVENLEKIVELPIVNRAELPDLFLEDLTEKKTKF